MPSVREGDDARNLQERSKMKDMRRFVEAGRRLSALGRCCEMKNVKAVHFVEMRKKSYCVEVCQI